MGHSPYQLDFFSINSLSVSSVPLGSSIAAQALQGLGIYRAIHWPYRLGRWPEGTHLLREQTNKPFQPTKTRDRFEKMTSFQGVGDMSILMFSNLVVLDVSFWKKKHIHSHQCQKDMEISKKKSCTKTQLFFPHSDHLPKPPKPPKPSPQTTRPEYRLKVHHPNV